MENPSALAQDVLPQLVKRIQPAVVSISTYTEDGTPLSQGSGFLLGGNNILITNRHVIEGSYRAIARFDDGKEVAVKAVKALESDALDLVEVELDSAGATNVLTLNYRIPDPGERIIVIGSPLGLDQSVSDGIVSAVRVIDGASQIQITAPISPGSSGSPVLNLQGEVVGIATSRLRDGQNLNFAIPSENIVQLNTGRIHSLREFGDLYVDSVIAAGGRLGSGHCDSAIRFFEFAIKLSPSHVAAWKLLGICKQMLALTDQAQWQKWVNEAIEAFRQAVRYGPNDTEAYRLLADALRDHGDYINAVVVYKKLIAMHPEDDQAHTGLAYSFQQLKRYAEAADEYNLVLSHKTDLHVLIELGDVYTSAGRKNEALAAYQRALELKPDDPWAHLHLGTYYASTANRSRAMNELRILRTLDPQMAKKLELIISLKW
jgi:hypothetical protein